jgi:two-component system phosphate regulon sensor histidine kinase PhoR
MGVRSLTGRLFTRSVLILGAGLLIAGVLLVRVAGARALPTIAINGALLGAIALVAAIPFRRMNRRFDELATSADALARGDEGVRVVVDEHDELALMARALNDVASRHERRLQDLKSERDASEAVLANLPQGLALMTRDLTIKHANPRFWAMVGVERSGTLGAPVAGAMPRAVRLPAARQPILEEMVEHSIRRGRSETRDVALYVEERREYEVTVMPIGARAGGAPEAWLLSVEDLRPEKAMAALRREFVANASHELKTPLTSIRGYAETLLSGGLEDEQNRARFVETIRAQAARLEALVEDLLELADLERPDAPLDLKDWDLGQVVREMVATFEDVAARRGLRLERDARPGIRARVDRVKIDLALRNLLDNAIKYTDVGTVTVRIERTASAIRISVADTGRGIEAEHIPRLFERFYRVDRGRSRALGGTGLGLSIVKHAVSLHGGRAGVESRVGEGSVFWIEIPPDGPHLHS